MSVTATEIQRVRRLVKDTTTSPDYTDAQITTFIEDAGGNLYHAAAAICEEKAAAWADRYDFTADGGTYDRGSVMENWLRLAERYRVAGGKLNGGTITLRKWPPEKRTRNVLADRKE